MRKYEKGKEQLKTFKRFIFCKSHLHKQSEEYNIYILIMSIYDEYYEAQRELEEKYGERSIVLMQVGSFYEVYGVDMPKIKIGHAEKISKILSMQVAYKNGREKPHSKKNPQMVGFPDHALGNHLEKLLKANYTVAIYDQYDTGDKKKSRKLVNVYSPSTFIDEDVGESHALMVIHTNEYKCPINNKKIEYAHLAILDMVTGEVFLTSVYDTPEDDNKVDTELYRMIHTYNPSEILYSGKQKDIEKRYDINNKKVYEKELNKTYTEIEYQNEFLKKIYKLDDTLIPCIEQLDLQLQSDVIPYFIQGLQYAYDHDPLILQNLKNPVLVQTDKRLILNNDSIYQLHLVESSVVDDYGDSKFTSVFNTINQTRTAMGHRLLKYRLLMPSTSKKLLNERYERIENTLPVYKKLDGMLKGICDMDRKCRKMAAKRLHPYELAAMRDSFMSIIDVLENGKELYDIDSDIIDEFSEFYEEYEATFDRAKMKTGKIGMTKGSYFNEGVSEKVDEAENMIIEYRELLEEVAKAISDKIDENKMCVSIMHNTTDGYYMKTTLIRYKNMTKEDIELESDTIEFDNLEIVKLKNVVKITCPKIRKISKKLTGAQFKLNSIITEAYLDILEEWSNKYSSMLFKVADLIGEVDFIVNAAKISKMYGYVRPIITKSSQSYVKASKLRHPVIERIVTKTEYISNDVEIGVENCGMILYGVNMSGKSSLLRSIGTAVVMAQAGMYVSASKFEYYPFTNIISKITVQDNPFKGQSLFMVEMNEVNNMLRRGDERTLVLSDELCSSTETSSAHAIVACTLKKLADKNVKFIFSTHLHELQKIPAIKNDKNIKTMHFQVSVNDSEMIFDRTLKEGGIPDTYGLEIAKALGLPTDFIKDAFDIRDYLKENNSEILSTKKSKYHKGVFMHNCTHCGTNKSLETHHIKEQHTANDEGLISTDEYCINKNQKFNLIVLCRSCHMKMHSNK